MTQFQTISEPPDWLERVLRGAELSSIVLSGGHTWRFGFGDHGVITTDSLWRLLAPGEMVATSEDRGQAFGRQEAVDVCEKVVGRVKLGMTISAVTASPVTGDLRLEFGPSATLEIISASIGYEAWHLTARIDGENFELVAASGSFAVNRV